MPIHLPKSYRRLSQAEFGDISYEVMKHVFAIHNEIGRFFKETIFKVELANRMPQIRIEEPVDVTFDSFHKRYFLDVLVQNGAIFEFKAVESLIERHRAQLLNYLLLCGPTHGKLINIRPTDVEHEFANTQLELADRTRFSICTERWNDACGTERLPGVLIPMLRDIGTGLEVPCYEEAITHFFGGKERVEADVAVIIGGRKVGEQRMRVIEPGVALKITAFEGSTGAFETHARRLLSHLDLHTIAWVNITLREVKFTSLKK